MEAQIHSIAARVISYLMSPVVWSVLAVSFMALLTGLPGRVALLAEDLRSTRFRSLSG